MCSDALSTPVLSFGQGGAAARTPWASRHVLSALHSFSKALQRRVKLSKASLKTGF